LCNGDKLKNIWLKHVQTMVMLKVCYECDFPILESVSHAFGGLPL